MVQGQLMQKPALLVLCHLGATITRELSAARYSQFQLLCATQALQSHWLRDEHGPQGASRYSGDLRPMQGHGTLADDSMWGLGILALATPDTGLNAILDPATAVSIEEGKAFPGPGMEEVLWG